MIIRLEDMKKRKNYEQKEIYLASESEAETSYKNGFSTDIESMEHLDTEKKMHKAERLEETRELRGANSKVYRMNDGTEQVSPEEFKHNIMGMKGQILKNNSSTEFILIATTVANAESVFDGCQREYRDVLAECMNPGDVLVNMTEVHDALLSRKKFCDMTGNNINHPNDYLVRVYAQVILQLIQKALSFS